MSSAQIVTIDGPAGAGKSTVSRRVADALGVEMLDTGAMYRAVTLAVLRAGGDVDDAVACGAAAAAATIELRDGATTLDGADVSTEIRTPEVTRAVSAVSAHAGVRAALVAHQRRWAEQRRGGVVEGRDIGSVVFPDARCKVYLDASAQERARRRQADEVAAGRTVAIDELVAEIERRDHLDSTRAVSPLVRPDDALVIDTDGRTIDEVVAAIVEHHRRTAAASDEGER